MSALSTPVIFVRSIAWGILLILTLPLMAQDVPAREQPRPYEGVVDPALRAAFEGMKALEERVQSSAGASDLTAAELGAVFGKPGNFEVMQTLLEQVANAGPEDLKVAAKDGYLYGAITMGIFSGRPEVVPALKRLAWSEEKQVRDWVADSEAYHQLPVVPEDLLLEVVKSAEARLPAVLDKSVVSGAETQGQYREFKNRLALYCGRAGKSGWAAVEPVVDRVVARGGDRALRHALEGELEQQRTKKRRMATEVVRGAVTDVRWYSHVEGWYLWGGLLAVLVMVAVVLVRVWWFRDRGLGNR